jgi:hypothetical protein
MRDSQIHAMSEASTRRFMLLIQQFEFLDTRMMAYEDVLSTTMGKIRACISPGWLKTEVDYRQSKLLAQRKEQMRAAMSKPKILTAV